MSRALSSATLIGHFGREPEMYHTTPGELVANARLVTSRATRGYIRMMVPLHSEGED